MSAILVDSNVIIDIVTNDPAWGPWSATAVARLAEEAVLVINPVIYAEVSIDYATIEELDDALPTRLFVREPIPYEAAFLAGRCFVDYKRRGGMRRSSLPDFYIGAHAAIAGYRLLTRDATRYRTYFPTLTLIAPEEGVLAGADDADAADEEVLFDRTDIPVRAIDRLIAEGRARPARRRGPFPSRVVLPPGVSATAEVLRERADDDR